MIISAFLEHNQDNRSGIVITLDVINLFTVGLETLLFVI